MPWPILAAWSDPAVSDPDLLADLAALDPNAALGVAVNPNTPAELRQRIAASTKLTVDNARILAQHVVPLLSATDQAELARRAIRHTETATDLIVTACDDDALLEIVRRYGRQRVGNIAAGEAFNRLNKHAEPTPALRAITQISQAHASWAGEAIVHAWQDHDLRVMEQLFDVHDGAAVPAHATLGMPGLATQWFARGGRYRVAAAHDLDVPVSLVQEWVDTDPSLAGEEGKENYELLLALIANLAVPIEPLRQVMMRLVDLRWPEGGPAEGMLSRIKRVFGAFDERIEQAPWHLSNVAGAINGTDTAARQRLLDALSNNDSYFESVLGACAVHARGDYKLLHELLIRRELSLYDVALTPVVKKMLTWHATPLMKGLAARPGCWRTLDIFHKLTGTSVGEVLEDPEAARYTLLCRYTRPSRFIDPDWYWKELIAVEKATLNGQTVFVSHLAPLLVKELTSAEQWRALLVTMHNAIPARAYRSSQSLNQLTPQQAIKQVQIKVPAKPVKPSGPSLTDLVGNALGDD